MPETTSSSKAGTLPRHMGLFGLRLLVVNGLIGAGILWRAIRQGAQIHLQAINLAL
ncbi:hypothetical protein [Rheinheimera gaetbuli]